MHWIVLIVKGEHTWEHTSTWYQWYEINKHLSTLICWQSQRGLSGSSTCRNLKNDHLAMVLFCQGTLTHSTWQRRPRATPKVNLSVSHSMATNKGHLKKGSDLFTYIYLEESIVFLSLNDPFLRGRQSSVQQGWLLKHYWRVLIHATETRISV